VRQVSAGNRLIGSAIPRTEDLRFVRGAGEYVADVSREGQLHAFILRGGVAHGRIRRISADRALAMPGVHAVISASDLPQPIPSVDIRLQPMPSLVAFHQPVLAHNVLRYVGEPVAVLLAETAALAEDAAGLVDVEIEALPPVTNIEASRRGDSLLYPQHGSNLAVTYTAVLGDAERVFAGAPYRRCETFRVHRHAAVPMEPRGLLAEWDSATGKLTVSGAAKVAFFNRRMLAAKLGLPEDRVDLIENDVGGGFGARGEFYPEDFLIPFCAKHLARPVKWIEDRRENLVATQHARDAECEIEIACARDGAILGLRGTAYCDVGAYIRTNGLVAPRNIAQFFSGPYRIANIHLESSVQFTNKTPSGTYRGPGRYEADFFRERLFDLVAADLAIDRVEFRRRNLVPKSAMPYAVAKITPCEAVTEYDSGNYVSTLDACLEKFDWRGKSQLAGHMSQGRCHGVAVGCFIEGGAAGPKENARIELGAGGAVTVSVGSSAIGQGLETVFGQITADALELPFSKVKVRHGSTTLLREGYGSYHSRAVVMGGSAILDAAKNFRDKLKRAAAKRWDCTPAEATMEDDRITGPGGRSIKLDELASDGISADGSFANLHHTYSYGAHAAHVAVDPVTGHVEVLDYVAVEDVGRIINPATLRGQVLGAVAQGMSGTFLERFAYDENGQPLSTNFGDYVMAGAADLPNIRVFLTEEEPSPINPLGAKGAGEGGIIPVGGVIANAVASALQQFGAEPHDLPLSPSNVWRLIEDARTQRFAPRQNQKEPRAAE
jgi:aerobic carbon-monoxide dehydrogenase large subunit